jgi:hypothetical protein
LEIDSLKDSRKRKIMNRTVMRISQPKENGNVDFTNVKINI